MLILVTPDGELNIYHEKYEFARDDFIAYIGGYLVSYLLCLGFHTDQCCLYYQRDASFAC